MDLRRFRYEMGMIGGVNCFGDPNLILVSGTEARFHEHGPLKYIKERGMKKKDILPANQKIWQLSYDFFDVPLNRWVIEEWVHPVFLKDHEKNRFTIDEHGKEVDMLGPFPFRGKYRALLILQDPKTLEPIAPDERILEILRKSKYETFKFIKHKEDEEPTEEEINKANEDAAMEWLKKQQSLSTMLSDMVDDAMKTHEHRFNLANHREGMHSRFRRGSTYDANWYSNMKKETKQNELLRTA